MADTFNLHKTRAGSLLDDDMWGAQIYSYKATERYGRPDLRNLDTLGALSSVIFKVPLATLKDMWLVKAGAAWVGEDAIFAFARESSDWGDAFARLQARHCFEEYFVREKNQKYFRLIQE